MTQLEARYHSPWGEVHLLFTISRVVALETGRNISIYLALVVQNQSKFSIYKAVTSGT